MPAMLKANLATTADGTVAMDKVPMVETGTHDERVRQDGLYAHLARLQFAA